MSAVVPTSGASLRQQPLAVGDARRSIAVENGQGIALHTFLAQVRGVAALLPPGRYAVNLCEDRYRFLVSFCAIALPGQITLLRVVARAGGGRRCAVALRRQLLPGRRRAAAGAAELLASARSAAAARRRNARDRRCGHRRHRLHLGQHRRSAAQCQKLGRVPRQHPAESRRIAKPVAGHAPVRGGHRAAAAHVRHGAVGAAAAAGPGLRARGASVLSRGRGPRAGRNAATAAARDHAGAPARAGRIRGGAAAAVRHRLGHRAAVAGTGGLGRSALRLRSARDVRLHRNLRDRAPPHRARIGVDAAVRRGPAAGARRHPGAGSASAAAGAAGRHGGSAGRRPLPSARPPGRSAWKSPANALRWAT